MKKHVIAAMLIAPILALIAYFGVDYLVREKPLAVQPGGHYKLNVKPNCRWESGRCTLVNADVSFDLSYARSVVTIDSAVQAERILVALAKEAESATTTPVPLSSADGAAFYFETGRLEPGWFIQFSALVKEAWFHALVPLRFTAKPE